MKTNSVLMFVILILSGHLSYSTHSTSLPHPQNNNKLTEHIDQSYLEHISFEINAKSNE